jgi:hypothetical protein
MFVGLRLDEREAAIASPGQHRKRRTCQVRGCQEITLLSRSLISNRGETHNLLQLLITSRGQHATGQICT